MSYEDTIRVADLEVRAGRFKRVREEVRAGPEEILGITEYMHPRLEEVCEMLPADLGRRVPARSRLSSWPSPLFGTGRPGEPSGVRSDARRGGKECVPPGKT